jgi:hypothetical protein
MFSYIINQESLTLTKPRMQGHREGREYVCMFTHHIEDLVEQIVEMD